jgi:nicotinate-nucleotide--dimethylbenzimidazole phosphoribosyltransferase
MAHGLFYPRVGWYVSPMPGWYTSPMNEMEQLQDLIVSISPTDGSARDRALVRQAQLTKPAGSLGRLEEISVWLAEIYGTEKPVIAGKTVIVCAGDHGVTREGISAYPSEVTPAMVQNFLAGGAAVSAIARVVGAKVMVLDVGVNADLPDHADLIRAKVRRGTGNIAKEPAMTQLETAQAILAGANAAKLAIENGANLLAAGDMGIGNTTPSAALTAWLTGKDAIEVTGRGTGIDIITLSRKVSIIELVLDGAREAGLEPDDALGALEVMGGLEIAAMVGVMLQGARAKVPVIVDGFIAGAAALVACSLSDRVCNYLTASHVSQEPGHRIQLEHLKLQPLFDYGLRLGEGTGALLAMPVLEAAARTLSEMATFAEASVPDRPN